MSTSDNSQQNCLPWQHHLPCYVLEAVFTLVTVVTHWEQQPFLPCVSIPVTFVLLLNSTCSHWLPSFVWADHAPVRLAVALKSSLALAAPWYKPYLYSEDAVIWWFGIVPSYTQCRIACCGWNSWRSQSMRQTVLRAPFCTGGRWETGS